MTQDIRHILHPLIYIAMLVTIYLRTSVLSSHCSLLEMKKLGLRGVKLIF